MSRKKVELPDYPTALLQPWRNDHTQAEFEEILGALCDHYELEHPSTRPVSNDFMAALALKLLRDFVPAFREPKPAGRRPSDHVTKEEELAYQEAGGEGGRYMVEPYIEACFVLQVRKLKREHGSLKSVFNKLGSGMPAGVELRNQLPQRYQRLRKSATFEDVWRNISPFVRRYPEKFIPVPRRD